jgi:hypothetical protein
LFAELRARVTDPRLVQFADYLERKRGGRKFLSRRDIDPLELKFILGNIMLFDVLHQPLRFHYRLVGTNLVQVRHLDMTGKMLEKQPAPVVAESVRRYLTRIVETCRPRLSRVDAPSDSNPGGYESPGVPSSEDGSTINMIVSGMGTPRKDSAG